ncbi:MAG: UbiA-like polyprenyltransferase [Pontiellaceae bacterium]
MIGVLFATEMEAAAFQNRDVSDDVVVKVAGEMGLEAARIAAEELVEAGATTIINAGVCAALHNRVERGSVYRISTVITEELKAAVNVGVGLGLKKLVSVEEPLYQADRKRELARQYDLVDMEGYAVARVCETHQIPCILIKGVTDFGDTKAKKDIKTHIAPVSETVADAILFVLDGIELRSKKRLDSTTAGLDVSDHTEGVVKRLQRFTKIEHLIFSLPLLFAGAWLGAGGLPSLSVLLWITLAGLGARTFGMALNRIFDRKIDAINPRTAGRELASGVLSLKQGYGVAFFGVVLYFVACAGLGELVLKLSLFPLIPLTIYSLLKRFTPLCHYGIGVALGFAPLGAYVAASGDLAVSSELVILCLFTFFWISGFDIIYALMDREFDQMHGVKSLPVAMSEKGALVVAAFTHLIAFSFLVILWMGFGGALSLLSLSVAAVAFGAAYVPTIPIAVRFFPISAIAGIAGALVVLLGGIS